MRWAASDVSPSSHLAFHIPTLAGFCLLFVLCSCLVLLLWCVFGFLFCECLGIPNSPRSLDLDDRQGLIARSAMQQKKKPDAPLVPAEQRTPSLFQRFAEVFRPLPFIGNLFKLVPDSSSQLHEASVMSKGLDTGGFSPPPLQVLTLHRPSQMTCPLPP